MPIPKDKRVRAWLRDQRLAAGYSNVRDKLLPALAEKDIRIDYSSYAAYESEASPRAIERRKDNLLDRLAEFYGVPSPVVGPPTPAVSDLDRLIASNLRLSLAIEEQNRLTGDEVVALRTVVDDLRARIAELVIGTGDQVQELTRRVKDLEGRLPAPRPSGRASGGSGGHRASSREAPANGGAGE